jgi:putative ABC transport system ATP-binding protein
LSDNGSTPVIEATGLTRDFRRGSAVVAALRGVDLLIGPGERVAIMGPSGCGKSTLLSLVGGLDRPTSGTIVLAGRDLDGCSRSALAILRRTIVGYVPQNAALLPMLTVEENVELPLALLGEDVSTRRARVIDLLDRVEMSTKARALPEELSGGQQQRAAIARALAARPRVVLADEPAGSLDTVTARAVLELIAEESRRENASLVLVTHEQDEAQYADRIVLMRDGLVQTHETARSPQEGQFA